MFCSVLAQKSYDCASLLESSRIAEFRLNIQDRVHRSGGKRDLLEGAGEEAEDGEYVEVGSEGGDDVDDDHRPLTEQEDRLTTDTVRQSREAHCSEHDADREDRLRQVLEVLALAHQVVLQPHRRHTAPSGAVA